jgi:hypothetical protein
MSRLTGLGLALALALAPAGALAAPSGCELLVSYPRAVAVIDPNQVNDWGTIPVPGTVEAALYVKEQAILLVHEPDVQELAIVDLKPFSPTRYQVLASYRSPELARKGLRFVQSGLRVYLAQGRTALAIVDPESLLAKLGVYTFDFLPIVAIDQVTLREGQFSLRDGQLTAEDPHPREPGPHVPVYIRLSDRPLEMLADPGHSRLFVSLTKPDGTGAIAVIDAAQRQQVREIAVPWPITSIAWLDSGEIAVLSAPRRRVGVYDTKLGRWARIWSPGIPGRPTRLIAAGAPPPAPAVVPEDEP